MRFADLRYFAKNSAGSQRPEVVAKRQETSGSSLLRMHTCCNLGSIAMPETKLGHLRQGSRYRTKSSCGASVVDRSAGGPRERPMSNVTGAGDG
jgi:hypothetical protein